MAATTTLFTTPTSTDQNPAALTAAIGAILLTVAEPVTLTALAEICGSDLTSVRTALQELKVVYAQTGGAIAESDEGVQLTSRQDSVDVDVVGRTIKWIHARQGLSPTEARLLDEHRRGVLSTQNFNADEHIAYARLINAGLATPNTSHEQPD